MSGVLIVQDDTFSRSRLHTVIAVVFTTNLRQSDAPGDVLLPAKTAGCGAGSSSSEGR